MAEKKSQSSKATQYSIVSEFKLGYRNREDVTNLRPGVLIVGSQNVMTNVSERVQIRQGYTVDGQVSDLAESVVSSFDWLTRGNGEVHMRAGGLTSAGNDGKLQFRREVTELSLNGGFVGNANGWYAFDGTSGSGSFLMLPSNGWSYGTNNAVYTPTPPFGYNLVQNIGLALSAQYRVTFDVVVNAGQIDLILGDGISTTYTTTQSVDSVFTSGDGTNNSNLNGFLHFAPDAIFDGTITNVSVSLAGSTSSVVWNDLMTGLTSVDFNFAKYWNVTESLREVLFVDGSSNIYEWNGAVTTISGSTANTLIKTGDTWADSGFYVAGNKVVVINGTAYTYTGGETTLTLTGVTPDPSAEPAGSVAYQEVVTTANSAMSGIPATFPNSLISTLNNQVFVASIDSSALYISKVNDFTDFTSSTPRQTGEGAVLILDDNLVGLKPQESFMYVTAGQDLWYNINFELQTSTVGVTYEQVNAEALKTGRRQAAISQAFISHMKNNIITVTQETTIDTFGRVESSLATPQTTNISDPIKLDIDQYDFTGGSIAYWRYYILVAVPVEGIVLIYNLSTNGWEPPQTLPITRFYIVNGELFGHSSSTFESYKLLTGYADRVYPGFEGFPIQANWVFSYQNYGSRFSFKSATKMYVEGYINANTTLNAAITYELDGCQTIKNFQLDGDNGQFVCLSTSGGSLGKVSLGKQKLGGAGTQSINGLPPKFRWFPTFTNTDFFECSISFSVLGTDERAELLAFGLAVYSSTQIPTTKMD